MASKHDSRKGYDFMSEADRAADYEANREPAKHVKLFAYPDDALVIMCEDSDFDMSDKVVSICQYWRDKRYLSEKQKWCLAYFAAYGSNSKEERDNPNPLQPHRSIDDDDIPF